MDLHTPTQDTLPRLRQMRAPLPGPDLEVISDYSSFRALELDWVTLRPCSARDSALHEWSVLESWWRHFCSEDPEIRLHVVVTRRRGVATGIFPFYFRSGNAVSVRLLCMLGQSYRRELRSPVEEALYLVHREYEKDSIEELLAHLRSELGNGNWDAVSMDLLNVVLPDRLATFKKVKSGPQTVLLPSTWEAFRRSLSKSMRDNLNYYARLLNRHGHSWCVRLTFGGEDLSSACKELVRLHKLRSQCDSRVGHLDYFANQSQAEFLLDVHLKLGPTGRAFVGVLEVEGKIVAAQSFFRSEDELLVGYSGFDLDWSAYSPLFVLECEVMKRAVDYGIGRVNLLYGDAPWQKRWKPVSPDQLLKVMCVSLRPASVARLIGHLAKREVCRAIQKADLPRRWKGIREKISVTGLSVPIEHWHGATRAVRVVHFLAQHHHHISALRH